MEQPSAVGEGGWLDGTTDQKLETVSRHLPGFDMAMVETGYRYNQLYWAWRDDNWEIADYQATKIRTAVENGLERRPKRAASAETFLTIILPAVEAAITERNATLLGDRLGALTSGCSACHEAERSRSFASARPRSD